MPKRISIVKLLTWFTIGIILLQTIIFIAFLSFGGALDEARSNAYQLFHDKVLSRKDYVQREMKNKWLNFEPFVNDIQENLKLTDNAVDFFDMSIDTLISMLRTTQVTGAYVVLLDNTEDTENIPALYLRDYDPVLNNYGDDDIYMVCGPSGLANTLKLPLDQAWMPRLTLTQSNRDFIDMPLSVASSASKANVSGYWSKPFKLSDNDLDIITYSMPLYDEQGVLKGIIGIDITLNYLSEYFPASELQLQDSLGYLLAYRDEDASNPDALMPMVLNGTLQKRMIQMDEALTLLPIEQTLNVYALTNLENGDTLYTVVEPFNLYGYNTPFTGETWYLVGIMRSDYLLSYVNRINHILLVSLLISVLIGAFGGINISYQMTKPMTTLAHHVANSDLNEELKFMPTGLIELDALTEVIEGTNKLMLESASRLSKIVDMFDLPIAAFECNDVTDHVFITNNFWGILSVDILPSTAFTCSAFNAVMADLFQISEPDFEDVYALDQRFVRYKVTDSDQNKIGVIMDVTDEVIEKRQIMKERDHDALTLILNRKGFQSQFEKWRASHPYDLAALVMFDLDNLKMINDTYGHHWGDAYIVETVKHLKAIAPEHQLTIGRRSGDEFIALIHGYHQKEDIRKRLDSFYLHLAQKPLTLPDHKYISIAISGGLIWIDNNTLDYDQLLSRADEALYASKRSGKGRYTETSSNANFDV